MPTMLDQLRKVVPAQLGFLAIYNPSLGTSDETIEDQIVYYSASEHVQTTKQTSPDQNAAHVAARKEEQNEQLRQIGLAQGMVEFGRSFSAGRAVDTVETEKSRIVLHELEAGWWILASINLTVLPITPKPAPLIKGKSTEQDESLEYSSREVKPAVLLLNDLLRAHSTFLLHHASSMSALFVRTKRSRFVSMLGRFWDTFVASWNVLMHGNPAVNLYGGIKVAACGELGVGVGEEDRGSGEREVLEGFVGRVNGLIDVVVSKFGDVDPTQATPKAEQNQDFQAQPTSPWLGSGNEPAAEDGAIFLGIGALSRKSVQDISHWIEDIYTYGPYAYGVLDNPSSTRRSKRPKKAQTLKAVASEDSGRSPLQTDGADDIESKSPTQTDSISPQPGDDGDAPKGKPRKIRHRRPSLRRGPSSSGSTNSEPRKGNRYMRYLKLGYGTHWNLGSSPGSDGTVESSEVRPPSQAAVSASIAPVNNGPEAQSTPKPVDEKVSFNDSLPHYLVGLMGDIENNDEELQENESEHEDSPVTNHGNSRLLLRTLTLELEREEDVKAEADISIDLGSGSEPLSTHATSEHSSTAVSTYDSPDRNKTQRLRVVVYANRPFIFVFLFELGTDTLALGSLYKSMHYQLAPLIKPLLISTTFRAARPEATSTDDSTTPIYDLVWGPHARTVNSTIPNVPDPGTYMDTEGPFPWSRMDALNTHMQIINTYIAATMDPSELERTCKTSRGWWIVWTAIPQDEENNPSVSLNSGPVKIPGLIHEDSGEAEGDDLRGPTLKQIQGKSENTLTVPSSLVSGPAYPSPSLDRLEVRPKHKEIFLVRRASDHPASRSRYLSPSNFTSSKTGWSGIGIDTKKYIDGLLNLNR